MEYQDRMGKAITAAAAGQAHDPQVQEASAMVALQAERTVPAALMLLAEFATTHDRSVSSVAHDIVDLRLRFDVTGHSHQLPIAGR